jgi:FkbM family methyltransferase
MKRKMDNLTQELILQRYEIKPGKDAFRYIQSWFALKRLARNVTKRDQKYFLDITSGVDRAILNIGTFEKAIVDIIRDICVSTGYTDHLVDIGANIGNHTVSLADVFKQVTAIEPNPVIFKILEANVLRNKKHNVKCYNFGLAEEKAAATLVATSENHSLGKVKQRTMLGADAFSIGEDSFDIEHEIQLEATSTFFAGFSGMNTKTFIKIDVEGMEQEILMQLLNFIRVENPIIGFEWYVREQMGIKDIITSLPNYNAYVVDSNESAVLNPALKLVQLLLNGRKFSMQQYNPEKLKNSYPLVMLIPSTLNLDTIID